MVKEVEEFERAKGGNFEQFEAELDDLFEYNCITPICKQFEPIIKTVD
jgi:hypothetical protein